MASFRPILPEGFSIHIPPGFNGDHYDFWKIRIQIFIKSQNLEIWKAIEEGPYIPMLDIEGIKQPKPRDAWNNEDKKKVQYDLKAMNILTSALGMDEFFRVSTCKSAKEIWDTLEVTHVGTDEVKRSRINTLSQEYEMFRMLPRETILDMQKRFTHLINHLIALGKIFTNNDLNLKVLRSLSREWQPKVTAISEKKSLSKMTLAALFGKLQEHELELYRLEQQEGIDNNMRPIALKTKAKAYDSSQDEESQSDSDEDDEIIEVLVKKLSKIMKRSKGVKSDQVKRNRFKGKKVRKTKRTHIDNEVSSSSESENGEAHFALMTSYHDEVSNDKPTCFYCSTIGHISNACLVRNSNGKFARAKKDTNLQGPKKYWVPRKNQ